MTPRLLPLGRITRFTVAGQVRELTDPDGQPTTRQLFSLWHDGMLAIVRPDARNEFSKAEAAWALDWSRREEAA